MWTVGLKKATTKCFAAPGGYDLFTVGLLKTRKIPFCPFWARPKQKNLILIFFSFFFLAIVLWSKIKVFAHFQKNIFIFKVHATFENEKFAEILELDSQKSSISLHPTGYRVKTEFFVFETHLQRSKFLFFLNKSWWTKHWKYLYVHCTVWYISY